MIARWLAAGWLLTLDQSVDASAVGIGWYNIAMQERVLKNRLWSVIMLGVIGLLVWLPQGGSASLRFDTTDSDQLQVHFLDVGQGDATLIETKEGIQVLIDGGPDSSVLRELSNVLALTDRYIDIVVATHPDKDHISGLIDVLDRYEVGMLVLTENKSDTLTTETYLNAVDEEEGAKIIYARRGQTWQLGASTTLRVLFPDTDPTNMESNTSSIVLQLTYGDTKFLFTGDSPKAIEEYLVLTEGEHLKSDVLKVGHHGSRTSTSELFLDEVQPKYAVISAGRNNRYGHPHVEVTDMLFNKRIQTLNTADRGTITFMSDGEEIFVE